MKRIRNLLIVALFLRLVLVFAASYHPDILNHVDWGNRFWQYGAKNFYEQVFWGVSWPNQPLGSIYLFALIAKLNRLIFSFFWKLNLRFSFFPSFVFPFLEVKLHPILLKLPFVLADLGLGWLIYKIIFSLTKNERSAFWGSFFFLFNPPLIYNSAVWGQTDSLINLLALFGLWQFYQKRYLLGVGGVLFSLFFKMSLIIWLPVFGVLFWYYREDWLKIIAAGIGTMALLLCLSLPAVHHGNVFSWLWYLYTNRILPRQGNMLSGNAFNWWTLIYGINLGLKQNILFLGLRAQIWGAGLTLTTMLGSVFVFFFRKKKMNFSNLLYLAVIFSFVSFLFLTNMHERYLYPVFAPLAILVVKKKVTAFGYWLISVIHWLNLYNLWWYPNVAFLKRFLEFGNSLVPRILSMVLIGYFTSLLVSYNRNSGD